MAHFIDRTVSAANACYFENTPRVSGNTHPRIFPRTRSSQPETVFQVDDKSAVDLAVERGDTFVLKELLAAGPHADALSDGGLSAMGIAAQGGFAKVSVYHTVSSAGSCVCGLIQVISLNLGGGSFPPFFGSAGPSRRLDVDAVRSMPVGANRSSAHVFMTKETTHQAIGLRFSAIYYLNYYCLSSPRPPISSRLIPPRRSILRISPSHSTSLKALDALIDAGAEVDEPNDDADTPLHLACMHLQPDSVRTLLRRGADETLRNDDLNRPGDVVGHHVSEDNRDEEVVEWIREV